MTGWLLDTNILSELRRPRPEPRVVDFIAGLPLAQIYVSVVTLAEIRFGIELVAEPSCRAELHDWLSSTVRPMFDERICRLRKTSCSNGGYWLRKAAA